MTQGFDIDELERALARSKAEPEDLEDQGFWTEARVITIFPDMIAEIRELRATVATLGDSARAGANVLDAKDTEIRELRAENARLREALFELQNQDIGRLHDLLNQALLLMRDDDMGLPGSDHWVWALDAIAALGGKK